MPTRKPLEGNEVVIHVPKGEEKNIRIEPVEPGEAQAEITVRISKNRRSTSKPVLGVMPK